MCLLAGLHDARRHCFKPGDGSAKMADWLAVMVATGWLM
jgi:hypothetical protein